jgi:hypothetical protein
VVAGRWRGGCLWLLGALLGALLLISTLTGIGLIIGLRQPDHLWATPVGRGYFAIGRIVGSGDCRRLRARGFPCEQQLGAVLYLPQPGPQGHGVEYRLFAFPEPLLWE